MDRRIMMKRQLLPCLALLAATFALAQPPTSDIGYKTVAQALSSLKLEKDAAFSTVRGWTIVTDETHLTVWSFAPRTDPSYPAVVKRTVTSTGAGSRVTTRILCEADKRSCDNLAREFNNLNPH